MASGSLLEQFISGNISYSYNTKLAYVNDLYVYFRELFTHFWEFDMKFNGIARDVAIQYARNVVEEGREKGLITDAEAGRQLDRIQVRSTKGALRMLPSYPNLGGGPQLRIEGGKLIMNLEPTPPEGIEQYVLVRKRDVALVNVVFYEHADEIRPAFLHDIFAVQKVGAVFAHMRDHHRHSASTIVRRSYALSAFEQFLEDNGYVERIQLHKLKRPRKERHPQPYLTMEEMLRVLDQASPKYDDEGTQRDNFSVRDRAILEIFFGTGIRVSELGGIRFKDMDLETRTVHVTKTKGGSSRDVALPDGSVRYVEVFFKAWDELYGDRHGQNDYIFRSRNKGRMHRVSIFRRIQRYVDKAGIKKHISPHGIRRTAATTLVEQGADILSVKEFLGHRNVTTTQDYIGASAVNQGKLLRKYHPRGS